MSQLEGKALRNAMLLDARDSMQLFSKAENMGEAHLRAEVNHEAHTVGNVASLAAVYTEPLPSGGAA